MSHERNWWELPAWREPSETPRQKLGPLVMFNPQCKHQRTSYDIVNCDACNAFTASLLKLRAEAAASEVAVPKAIAPTPPTKS